MKTASFPLACSRCPHVSAHEHHLFFPNRLLTVSKVQKIPATPAFRNRPAADARFHREPRSLSMASSLLMTEAEADLIIDLGDLATSLLAPTAADPFALEPKKTTPNDEDSSESDERGGGPAGRTPLAAAAAIAAPMRPSSSHAGSCRAIARCSSLRCLAASVVRGGDFQPPSKRICGLHLRVRLALLGHFRLTVIITTRT